MGRNNKDNSPKKIKWKEETKKSKTAEGRNAYLSIKLQTPESITYIVTDGGERKILGYYGWIIASEENVIFSGHGRLAY